MKTQKEAKETHEHASTLATNVSQKPSMPRVVLIGLLFVITVIAVYGAWYYRSKALPVINPVSQAQLTPQERAKSLASEVSMLASVPNEEPTVADVADVTKLSGQPFFSQAQNGDVVFIYQKAKRAILYRPGEKKIVEATSVALNEPSPTSSPAPTGTKKAAKLSPTEKPTGGN